MQRKSKDLDKEIDGLKKQLLEIGPMRPGSLSKQCRHTKKGAYGEYWQLSYTFNKLGHTEYIPGPAVKAVQAEVKNYQAFRKVIDKIIDLSIKASQERLQKERA
jgi:hypothetical protein